MKPQPPEYPRPVPDIDFEEDPILPGTIVYTYDSEDDFSDAEALARHRAAKRRRVQANAHAYLRGEGLFILSAGLRGPLKEDWHSPWANKKRKHGDDGTAAKATFPKVVSSTRYRAMPPPQKQDTTTHVRQLTPINPFDRALQQSESPGREKVEHWLRRNRALPQYSEEPQPGSPTPKKRTTPQQQPQIKREWTPTKQRITVSSQDMKAPFHQPGQRVAKSFEPIVPAGRVQIDSKEAHSRLQDVLDVTKGTVNKGEDEVLGRVMDNREVVKRPEEPTRAEAAILKLKRRIIEVEQQPSPKRHCPGPSVLTTKNEDNPQNLLNGNRGESEKATERKDVSAVKLENNKGVDGQRPEGSVSALKLPRRQSSEVKLKKLEAIANEQISQASKDQQEQQEEQTDRIAEQNTYRSTMPPPSAVPSDMPSTSLPPSAQPRPELQVSVSNISSEAMFMKSVQVTSEGVTNSHGSAEQPQEEPEMVQKPQALVQSTAGIPKNVGLEPGRPLEVSAAKESETSAPELTMKNDSAALAAVVEGGDTTATDQEAQRAPDDIIHDESAAALHVASPISMKKAKQTRSQKPKATSFTAEQSSLSSNGSIKNGFKVQKRMSDIGTVRKTSPPSPLFAEPDLTMDTSIENHDESFHSPVAPSRQKSSVPKSILKRANRSGSGAAALASAALSSKVSANLSRQNFLVSGQNGMAREDGGFDLDGAIDDLGSFLSTWDAEKDIRV